MTTRAFIRFYAELNDLLPSARRQRDVEYTFDVGPAVKDAIESMGVPHTEVDVVLVNGQSVDFAHRVADGDRISVYPVFETFDVGGIARLRPEPLRDIRFVVDTHLAKLARYLRLLGFDTRHEVEWPRSDLAAVSIAERRVLLTGDRGVLMRRDVTHGLFVRHDDPREQVIDVVRRLHLASRIDPFTRCMACNGVLEPVDKTHVVDRLPPETARHFDDFHRCSDCDRIYWQGAHHARLAALVDHVRKSAS